MDYTPKTNQQAQPKPSYELTTDVTGTPPASSIKSLKDKNGQEVKLPYPPKSNCKKCYGKGFLGYNNKNGRLIICIKCFPAILGKK